MSQTKTSSEGKLSLCVFCGAQNAVDAHYFELGENVGEAIAQAGLRMVFGGGDCGLMGATSNAAMRNGGEVVGVFPHHLRDHEAEHKGVTETIIVGSMHERKKLMFDLSDMFVILPGGFGTLDEMFEVLTWRQIGLHEKPVYILNYQGYWDALFELIDTIIGQKFAKPVNREFYQVIHSVDELKAAIRTEQNKKNAVNA